MKVHRIVAVCALVLFFGLRANGQVYEFDPGSDAYEFNEDFADAKYLQSWHQLIANLSIMPLNDDDDWYWWTAWTAGDLTVTVTEVGAGALQLEVYVRNANGTLGQLIGSSATAGQTETVMVTGVTAGNGYYIRVLSASGATNDNYVLEVKGTAARNNGTPNRNPAANPNTTTADEAKLKPAIDVLANDVDPDTDTLTLHLHSDWYGRGTVSANKMNYLPATSLTQTHDFTYVADDGRGGRSKAKVTVSINPLTGSPLPAFPEAEGFGSHSTGGRNSAITNPDQLVHRVTNLNDSGTGSLRHAVQGVTGPRIVVFDVGGTINLASILRVGSKITIAGETAPGDGITVFGRETRIDDVNNVVVRYIRFRLNENAPAAEDALTVVAPLSKTTSNVIIDHCSLSWGRDGTIDVWNSDKVTVQWCIISETLLTHSLGTIVGADFSAARYVTMHHNLWAHNNGRTPWVERDNNVDVINNVIYNWGNPARPYDKFATQIGISGMPPSKANVDGNYYIAGPDTDTTMMEPNNDDTAPARAIGESSTNKTEVYFGRSVLGQCTNTIPASASNPGSTNLTDLDKDSNHAAAAGAPLCPIIYGSAVEKTAQIVWPVTGIDPAVTTHTADEAYKRVLGMSPYDPQAAAGAALVRDATDNRIIDDVKTRDPNGRLVSAPPDPPQ